MGQSFLRIGPGDPHQCCPDRKFRFNSSEKINRIILIAEQKFDLIFFDLADCNFLHFRPPSEFFQLDSIHSLNFYYVSSSVRTFSSSTNQFLVQKHLTVLTSTQVTNIKSSGFLFRKAFYGTNSKCKIIIRPKSFFKNGPTPASFSFIFGLFKQSIQFLQQNNVKNVMTI